MSWVCLGVFRLGMGTYWLYCIDCNPLSLSGHGLFITSTSRITYNIPSVAP